MGVTYLFRGLKPFEQRLIHVSNVGILICIYLLLFHNFSSADKNKLEKEIGVLTEAKSDIRIKNYSNTLWQSAKKNQAVREGDKVYTGNRSFATINLMNESKIELKENSLVEFKKLKNQNLADLEEGEYRVAIAKNLRIAIKGQVANIEGDSEIILKIDKNKKISVQTLQGTPTIQYQTKTYKPTVENPVAIERINPETPVRSGESTNAGLQVDTQTKTYDYALKLYDIYERSGQQLKPKSNINSLVRMSVTLPVETNDRTTDIFVEYSNQQDLSGARRYSMDAMDLSLPQVYIGDNYWRAQQNKGLWSDTGHFVVRSTLLPASEVKANFSSTQLFLYKQQSAEVDVSLSTAAEANGFLVESSKNPNFDSTSTIYWSYQNNLHLRFSQPGTYFYRFRAVDENLKLGEWSETTKLEILDAPSLVAPQFARTEYKTTTGDSLLLSWSNPDQAKNFKVKILNTTEQKIVEKVVTDPFLRWTPKNAGDYYAEVRSLDSHNRISDAGRTNINVKAIQVRISEIEKPQKDIEKWEEEDREVASESAKEDIEIKTQYPTIQLGYNADFILSRFTFSTNYYDIVYSPALSASNDTPVATPGLQVAGLKWLGHHGAEFMAQKNLTSNEPGAADFYTAELRYHYRFYNGSDRPDRIGFHLSPFVGYELYGNSNSTYFISNYNMLKLGAFFELPIMKSWTMGLTGAYGTGSSLTKYEALWDISYFFKKQWTMGFGLKSSVIFGVTDEFPTYPEYREGYSLGQFNLRYFF
ncbi:FecR domain-containing protein [bacterium]|nr:FecR domain-containing protein [bacterium]